MSGGNIHISISAEKLFSIGSLEVTNSIVTSLICSSILILLALFVRLKLKPADKKPTGWQNVFEFLVEGFYDFIQGVTNSHKKTKIFLPFIVTFFLFILTNNWLGLVPGVGTIGFIEGKEKEVEMHQEASLVPQAYAEELETHEVEEEKHQGTYVPYFRAGTADLNTTMALAIITVFMTQFFGIKYLGLGYFKKFINFSNPMNFIVGLLELISEISKVLSFGFRLFGNIFAGEVLLVVIGALVPLVAPMIFYGLEVFVGLIQALVFALLSLVFYSMATVSHDEH
jgi:F-type H+-transporting ATPase subunit a